MTTTDAAGETTTSLQTVSLNKENYHQFIYGSVVDGSSEGLDDCSFLEEKPKM
jgi:hypothetical protein